MSKIRTECNHCNKTFVAPQKALGRELACPNCKNKFVVAIKPATSPGKTSRTAAPSTPSVKTKPADRLKQPLARNRVQARTEKDSTERRQPVKQNRLTRKERVKVMSAALSKSFREDSIGKSKSSPLYKLAAILVSMVMLILPFVYLGLIALTAYAVFYHAANHVGIMTVRGGGFYGMIFKALIYIAPIFGGTLVVIFLIKPIFARPFHKYHRRFITRESEPVLFKLIDKVCFAVNSPTPSKVYVDCDVNAAASFRTGFWSMFSRSDLALHFGMPLVSTLTVEQFAGVLAHEFGHFSQGLGMRLTNTVIGINAWFARVATEPDQIDQWLSDNIGEDDHFAIALLFMFAILCVYLTRFILFLFFLGSQAICCTLLRQMEFNADQFEAKLCGSKNFAETSQQIHISTAAANSVIYESIMNLMEKKKNKNIPKSVARRAEKLPSDLKREVQKELQQAETSVFHSHPCTRERIAKAAKLNVDGIFSDDRPASELFLDFQGLCEKVTSDFYRTNFNIKSKSEKREKDWMVE
jgi:Zn-dependent protease with chaperone function/DNA-directed RNA polymerase subunit RPC12/RpoP